MDFAKDWDKADTALLGAVLTGVYADIQSTKKHLEKGGEETNPLLPRKPSGQELDKAGLATALLGSGVAGLLDSKWRKPLLGAWAGLEHGLAYKNEHRKPSKKKESLAESGLEGPLMMAAVGGFLGHLATAPLSLGVQEDRRPDGAPSLGPLLRFDMTF